MFSREDLENIVKGNPTPQAIAAGQRAVAHADKGLPTATAERGGNGRPANLLESNDPLAIADNLEAMARRRAQRKAEQQPAAPTVLQEEAPARRPAEKFTPPPGGYPPPGLPVNGQRGGAGQYEAGEVPQSAISKFFPGMTPPASASTRPLLFEQSGQSSPAAPANVNTEEVRDIVREILFQEVLEQKTLLPLLENLVKTTLHLVVREELERLQRQGVAQKR